MASRCAIGFQSKVSSRSIRPGRRPSAQRALRGVEALESRELLATFSVTNLGDFGTGSFRQAIIAANRRPGPDTIDFKVAGVIRTVGTSLPSVTDTVTIDGTTAPRFAGSPVVALDFRGFKGLSFERGADFSVLKSLSLVQARNAGVTLNASHVTIQGNYIGILPDGRTVAGNGGDGVQINNVSNGNVIGNINPVKSISYYNANAVSIQPVTGWQGIRNGSTPGQYLLAGTSESNGLLYVGPITGAGGTSFTVNYPGATSTSLYGPDLLKNGDVRIVGSYKNGDDVVHGFVYEGSTDEFSQAGNYRTIDYPGAKFNYVHSTAGGLAVGNADGPEAGFPLGTGHAFLYDLNQNKFLPDIVFPGSLTTSAYGIWYNGGTKYTIAGGASRIAGSRGTVGEGFLVDYDAATGQFTHWTRFKDPSALDLLTHFEGISSDESGVYTLSADSLQPGTGNVDQASWVTVRRNTDGSFGPGVWVPLNYPGVDPKSAFTSNDSVAGNANVGIVASPSGVFSFQATVNIGFQLSNVISGNRGNGIGIYGSDGNQVAMNYIGTDATGFRPRGNARNGILITQGATHNKIGGEATGGNDPTNSVFVRPPQGNLISGNHQNGVLINGRSTQNALSGNFVGTGASGNTRLGNWLDGVAIVNASGNQLLGCTFQESPFVFYNVLSGNAQNGLRITDSNNTVVQANFMGVGANNATRVPNGNDGLLVSGSSRNTQVGGVIPLGNVISGNNRNGLEVRDRASGLISFNTFAGVYAFGGAAPNLGNGILITSTGGNNLVRTCIVSGNLGNGIEIGGNATGVQIMDTAVGTNTAIQKPIPNRGSGIKFSGNAHGNAVGGFRPSVEPEGVVSANLRFGIEFAGSAHDNVVFHTFLGTTAEGTSGQENLGNRLGGILLGPGTSSNTIGGQASALRNKVFNSLGNGVTILSSRDNTVMVNQIVGNRGFGLFAAGKCNGTVVRRNLFASNALGNVNIRNASGIVFIP